MSRLTKGAFTQADLDAAKAQGASEATAQTMNIVQLTISLVFGSGRRFQELLATELVGPSVNSDRTGIRFEHVNYAIEILPASGLVRVYDSTNDGTQAGEFKLRGNGTLTDEDQTMILGLIERISRTAGSGFDPVTETPLTAVADGATLVDASSIPVSVGAPADPDAEEDSAG